MSPDDLILHASAVSWEDRAVLLTGASGSGKSSVSLQLMALGARLVGDDRVILWREDGSLRVRPVPTVAGLIEARGMGILRADHAAQAQVVAVVDLDRPERTRLPDRHHTRVHGIDIRCFNKSENPTFPAAILQYLKRGEAEV
jgi:HPr kinase/phosphorylase